jgi:preprotein translocase subunit SecD
MRYSRIFLLANIIIACCISIVVHAQSVYLKTGMYRVADSTAHGSIKREYEIMGYTRILYLLPDPILTAKNIQSMKIEKSELDGQSELMVSFDKSGRKIWYDVTKELIDRQVAFVLDNKVLMASFIRAQIANGQFGIAGDTREDVEAIMQVLNKESKE